MKRSYQERFEKTKGCLELNLIIGSPFREDNIKTCRKSLKALQDEINANGCGVEYLYVRGRSDYKYPTYCVPETLCPTCQKLINEIEEVLR